VSGRQPVQAHRDAGVIGARAELFLVGGAALAVRFYSSDSLIVDSELRRLGRRRSVDDVRDRGQRIE
jgi:hypothetical protein